MRRLETIWKVASETEHLKQLQVTALSQRHWWRQRRRRCSSILICTYAMHITGTNHFIYYQQTICSLSGGVFFHFSVVVHYIKKSRIPALIQIPTAGMTAKEKNVANWLLSMGHWESERMNACSTHSFQLAVVRCTFECEHQNKNNHKFCLLRYFLFLSTKTSKKTRFY